VTGEEVRWDRGGSIPAGKYVYFKEKENEVMN
jgi:hypothetical protein